MTDIHAKRIAVLTAAAKAKSQAKAEAAEQGIRALVKRGEPITFQAVQREAGVSHAFLYGHPDLRGRIEHLRARSRQNTAPTVPPDSESTLVIALTAQINQLKTATPARREDPAGRSRTSPWREPRPTKRAHPPRSRRQPSNDPRRIDRNNDLTCKNAVPPGPNR